MTLVFAQSCINAAECCKGVGSMLHELSHQGRDSRNLVATLPSIPVNVKREDEWPAISHTRHPSNADNSCSLGWVGAVAVGRSQSFPLIPHYNMRLPLASLIERHPILLRIIRGAQYGRVYYDMWYAS